MLLSPVAALSCTVRFTCPVPGAGASAGVTAWAVGEAAGEEAGAGEGAEAVAAARI